MKTMYSRGLTIIPVAPWVSSTKEHESQWLSRTHHHRQLLGYAFYQSMRAAAAVSVLVISLHAHRIWTASPSTA